MDLDLIFTITVFFLILPVATFMGRNFIKEWIVRAVQHNFNEQLERLRADLKQNEEYLKSELRFKEAEIAALRDGVLSGSMQRQAIVDKRIRGT